MTENGNFKEKKEDNVPPNERNSQITIDKKKLKYLFKKIINYAHLKLNKDLEISKNQVLTLFLIFLSGISIIAVDIYLIFDTDHKLIKQICQSHETTSI